MARDVNFEGKLYRFPDDATDDEISQSLETAFPGPGFLSRTGTAISEAARSGLGAIRGAFNRFATPEVPDIGTAPLGQPPPTPQAPSIPSIFATPEVPDIGTAPLGQMPPIPSLGDIQQGAKDILTSDAARRAATFLLQAPPEGSFAREIYKFIPFPAFREALLHPNTPESAAAAAQYGTNPFPENIAGPVGAAIEGIRKVSPETAKLI